jgi:hypothetical protein
VIPIQAHTCNYWFHCTICSSPTPHPLPS